MKFNASRLCLLMTVSSLVVVAQFTNQFIGSSLSDEEAMTREFCETKVCLVDTEILMLAATQNATVAPCDDFKEFGLGVFIKYRALNDRYQYKGLQSDLDEQFREKNRKVVSAKVSENDPRVFKIMKSYFAKCVNSSE
jgi:hypothetical protein